MALQAIAATTVYSSRGCCYIIAPMLCTHVLHHDASPCNTSNHTSLYSYMSDSVTCASHFIVLPYLTLPYLPLPYLTLPYLTLPYLPCLALPCLALPYLALPRLASPCLASPRLALPCLALPRLMMSNLARRWFFPVSGTLDSWSPPPASRACGWDRQRRAPSAKKNVRKRKWKAGKRLGGRECEQPEQAKERVCTDLRGTQEVRYLSRG